MSTALTGSRSVDLPPLHSPMEIRGGWALLSLLFYPLVLLQVALPFWPNLFHGLATTLQLDPFRFYIGIATGSRVLLLLIIAAGLARAVVAAWGIHSRHQRVKEYFRTTQIPTSVLKDRLTALQQYELPFVVYGDPVPRAFVLGIFNTRIYISTGILDALDDLELGSVIMHEVHHHRNRDPLKGFLLSITSHLFFYIPLLRSYAEFWQQQREWEADAAAKRVSSPTSLAQALCKLLAISPHVSGTGGFAITSRQPAAGAPALHGMGNVRERIELLLELREIRPWRLHGREYIRSVVSLLALALLLLGLVPPVQLEVAANPEQAAPVAVRDAAGWVIPQRVDHFWVRPFQSEFRRIRRVGIDPATAPPPSRHQMLP